MVFMDRRLSMVEFMTSKACQSEGLRPVALGTLGLGQNVRTDLCRSRSFHFFTRAASMMPSRLPAAQTEDPHREVVRRHALELLHVLRPQRAADRHRRCTPASGSSTSSATSAGFMKSKSVLPSLPQVSSRNALNRNRLANFATSAGGTDLARSQSA